MKKISIAIMALLVVLSACKKVPEVNLKYVDVERDLITVGTTTATVQCDYEYIATLKKACLYYGEGENEADMNTAEMRVVQNTLYVDLAGLKGNTKYSYFYEFHNGFNSMRTTTRTFRTEGFGGGYSGDHEWVDLGLPSGTLWATCNIGANTPEENGDYFAWGETTIKDSYLMNNYKYFNEGDWYQITKYCFDSNYGCNGFTDTLTVLQSGDDAAVVNWGADWRIPTKAEWEELRQNTTFNWITKNGVKGMLFTSLNGNSLFLPAAGYHNGSGFNDEGYTCAYWSTLLYTIFNTRSAWNTYFGEGQFSMSGMYRWFGLSVRPVRKEGSPTPPSPPGNVPEGAINGLFTINENGDQVYFSQGNLQYQASTNTWRFAEHQWDYVGNDVFGTVYENGMKCDNGLISSTYNGWIDLFGWGTSGYNHGAVCYQPFSSIEDNTKYWIYGSDTMNLYDSSGQADWGYNRISNGGNREGLWRTLKGNSDELYYLLMSRNTSSGIRFATACVNGVKGIILFPDNWDAGIYHITNANANNSILFADNTVSLEDWNALLEPNGCVFLPVSGKRAYYSIVNLGEDYSYVDYWTSSMSVHNQDEYDISVLGFSDDGVYLCDATYTQRCYGSAVRLVQDATR